jgi:hypothetical protein
MACGAEMILVNVVQDPMDVPGFERRTFKCSGCLDVEQRLAFTRNGRESDAQPTPVHPAPPIAPASTVPDEPFVSPGLFRRVFAKLRSR